MAVAEHPEFVTPAGEPREQFDLVRALAEPLADADLLINDARGGLGVIEEAGVAGQVLLGTRPLPPPPRRRQFPGDLLRQMLAPRTARTVFPPGPRSASSRVTGGTHIGHGVSDMGVLLVVPLDRRPHARKET